MSESYHTVISSAGRERIAAANSEHGKRHLVEGGNECRCVIHQPPFSAPTSIENILVDVVLVDFPVVEREVPFGHFRVDAYLPPPYHIAFEADGDYWHARMGKRDAARDAWLLRKFGLPVVRLTETELRAIKE